MLSEVKGREKRQRMRSEVMLWVVDMNVEVAGNVELNSRGEVAATDRKE